MDSLDSASIRPILLVDDERALLDATRRRIEVALPQTKILAFVDGHAALAGTADEPLGLAILDVDMPTMSGLELAEALRARSPDLPILFLTGTAKANMANEYERVGAVAWLRKPVSGRILLDAVAAHALRTS